MHVHKAFMQVGLEACCGKKQETVHIHESNTRNITVMMSSQ
jgi:hypothetical protein